MGEFKLYCAGTNLDVLPGGYVDALLVNVLNDGGNVKQVKATLRLIRQSQASHVLLDSGGFQLYKAEEKGLHITSNPDLPASFGNTVNLAPEHVISAAIAIRPGKVVGLDFPIRKLKEQNEQEREFLSKLNFNVPWALQTAELRQRYCPDVELMLPIQCFNLEQLSTFMAFMRGVNFNGVSMPLRNLKAAGIVAFLVRFHELSIRQVHLLGSFSYEAIAIGAYAARHLFDWVSLDATTWRVGAEYSQFMHPSDLKNIRLADRDVLDTSLVNVCPCPWCRGRTYANIKLLPYPEKVNHIRCHNFWVTENIAAELYNHADTLVSLEQYMRLKVTKAGRVDQIVEALS